jgi:hypothetical protein
MIAEAVPLQFSGRVRAAYLRDLTGHDERSVSSTGTLDAINLLDALIEKPLVNEDIALRAEELTAPDRDRLLGAIYRRVFGDRVENTLTCASCGKPFDLDFSLSELTDSIYSRLSNDKLKIHSDGSFETDDGVRFRLPTGNDELASMKLSPDEAALFLIKSSIIGNEPLRSASDFEEMLDEFAPVIDVELTASCAECGHVHTVEFDIQTYLLGALLGERKRLMSEIHSVAAYYGWTLNEILTLKRTERRQLVDLIDNETSRSNMRPLR